MKVHRDSLHKRCNDSARWAPTGYKSSELTPISRVKSPQLPIYFRPFIGVPCHSIGKLVGGRGRSCGGDRHPGQSYPSTWDVLMVLDVTGLYITPI